MSNRRVDSTSGEDKIPPNRRLDSREDHSNPWTGCYCSVILALLANLVFVFLSSPQTFMLALMNPVLIGVVVLIVGVGILKLLLDRNARSRRAHGKASSG